MRYYYKDNKGNLFNYKSECLQEGYIQITEEEFNELTNPKELTAEQKAAYEKAKKIVEYKAYLEKTDYIVLKIAEALANNDTESVAALKSEYAEELGKRNRARILINSLENVSI